jgi:pimeloyl-ACP methyl ester carboxylesterase
MSAPRLFLVPQWSEVEWTIRPLLDEWAEVASYDPARSVAGGPVGRESLVEAGLEHLDSQGWDRFFVVGDTFGTATAVRIALARREAVEGIALGHASLSWDMEGDRAPINSELWAAMAQLMSQDAGAFVRYGITQLTQGSFDEEVARQLVDRVPPDQLHAFWTLIRDDHEPIGEVLGELDRPLLLAKHHGCLMFTDAGFDDMRAAFPSARTVGVEKAPCADEDFAGALREFCAG